MQSAFGIQNWHSNIPKTLNWLDTLIHFHNLRSVEIFVRWFVGQTHFVVQEWEWYCQIYQLRILSERSPNFLQSWSKHCQQMHCTGGSVFSEVIQMRNLCHTDVTWDPHTVSGPLTKGLSYNEEIRGCYNLTMWTQGQMYQLKEEI